MDYYTAIRLSALDAVLSGDDDEYVLRHIHRWYSKTFSTPLHLVEELPTEDVLTAYYESTYESMQDIERDRERATLLETEEELQARLRKEDEDKAIQADLLAQKTMMQEFFKTTKKNKLPGLGEMSEHLDLSNVVSGDKKGSIFPPESSFKMREPILPSPDDFPEISMRFLPDDEELPDLDSDPLEFGILNKPGTKGNLK